MQFVPKKSDGRPDLPRSLMSFATRNIPSRHSRTDLEKMVGENYRNLQKQTGNMETAHALIVKNSSNDNICLLPRFQLFSDGFNIPLHGHPFLGIFP